MSNHNEKAILELQCPCGEKVTVTENLEGELASLLHTLPMWREFEVLEPDEFLRWIRTTAEGRHDA